MSLLFYLSYVAVLVAFAFVTLSLASGLLYIAELIEEHSRLAKVIGQRGVYAVIILHIIFYFTESLPFKQTLFSIFCHIVYLQTFSPSWPMISLTSITFIASVGLVFADHFLWFFYFTRLTQDARHQRYYKGRAAITAPSFTEVATFFGACVWLIPLFIFLSLSANDHAIPLTSAEPSSPSVQKTRFQPRQSLLRSILSKIPGSKFSRSEGLIAPPSPSLYRSTSGLPMDPQLQTPGGTYQNALSPPPKSPSLRQSGFDFQLSTPPRRSSSGLRNGTLGGAGGVNVAQEKIGLGLSLRRANSTGVSSDGKREN